MSKLIAFRQTEYNDLVSILKKYCNLNPKEKLSIDEIYSIADRANYGCREHLKVIMDGQLANVARKLLREFEI